MNFNRVCKKVANQLGEDVDLVHDIATFQFKFIRDVMQDPVDTNDILLHKLFRFRLKKRFKLNKQTDYSPI